MDPKIFDELRDRGIKLRLVGEDVVATDRDESVFPSLPEEIQRNKSEIIRYLKMYSKCAVINQSSSDLNRNFEVTPIQEYWLNDNKDKYFKIFDKNHGSATITFEVSGDFRPTLFEKAVYFLIDRHESLRSQFLAIKQKFYMRVDSTDKYIQRHVFNERILGSDLDETEMYKYLYFLDHRFDILKDPLFICRLISVDQKIHLIGFKFHHIIIDAISLNIFLRELIMAYQSFSSNVIPNLPLLSVQYKDFLTSFNLAISKSFEVQKNYWQSLYSALPPEFIIPGGHRDTFDQSKRLGGYFKKKLSSDSVEYCRNISQKYLLTTFVVLQSTFCAYILNHFKIDDIIYGTYVHGRDSPEFIDQIGCYSRMALLRTKFQLNDSFTDILEKVNKSNHELRNLTACSLYDYFINTLPESIANDAFWNVNLFYLDFHPSVNNLIWDNSGIEFKRIENGVGTLLVDVDIQLYFIDTQNDIELQVCYDTSLYDSQVINDFISEYLDFCEQM